MIANCTRLAAEWQTYIIRSKSLRKVFLSIKGIYYQAQVEGQSVTWLVPYAFTQRVPSDIDFRIMLTFLELYQTLLGFVFFKLFHSINLIYPPKLDFEKDEAGAGLGALLLEQAGQKLVAAQGSDLQTDVTVKDVKQQIRELAKKPLGDLPDEEARNEGMEKIEEDEESKERIGLFSNYVFFISREVTRPMLEFVIRSFGGEVGWDPILGSGSNFVETDPRITHHIIDRPTLLSALTPFQSQRAFVQPQWVIDCINQSSLLPTEPYGPGKILPPHLSPFVDHEDLRREGGYIPEGAEAISDAQAKDQVEDEDDEEDEDEDEDEMEVDEEEAKVTKTASKKPIDSNPRPALEAAAEDPNDPTLLHAAEIEAEELGISHAEFESQLKKLVRQKGTKKSKKMDDEEGKEINEAMLTGKQRKLYQKMSFTKHRRAEERNKLEAKKKALVNGNKKNESKVKEKEKGKGKKMKV